MEYKFESRKCKKEGCENRVTSGKYCSVSCAQSAAAKNAWKRDSYRKKIYAAKAENREIFVRKITAAMTKRFAPLSERLKLRNRLSPAWRWARAEATGLKLACRKSSYNGSNEIPVRDKFTLKVFQKLEENPTVIEWEYLPYFITVIDDKIRSIPVDLRVRYKDRTSLVFLLEKGASFEFLKYLPKIEEFCKEKNFTDVQFWTAETIS